MRCTAHRKGRPTWLGRYRGNGSKLRSYFFAVCGPKFTRLRQQMWERSCLQCCFPIIDILFRSGDIHDWSAKLSKIAPKKACFSAPIFLIFTCHSHLYDNSWRSTCFTLIHHSQCFQKSHHFYTAHMASLPIHTFSQCSMYSSHSAIYPCNFSIPPLLSITIFLPEFLTQ